MGYTWIRCRRSPLFTAAVFLFSGLIALALGSLQRGLLSAQSHYDEIYRQIRVACTVTNLTGEQSNYLNIPPQIHSLFTEGTSLQFSGEGREFTLAGITALQADPNLWPENGCAIFWNEGAGDWVFAGKELKCLVSEELMKELRDREFPKDSFAIHLEAGDLWGREYDVELEIAGTYAGEAEKTIYCPWEAYLEICQNAMRGAIADSLSATLKDNG